MIKLKPNFKYFPKKILMTADSIGGVWTYCTDLCKKFNEYNIKVALAVMGKKLSEQQHEEISELRNVQLYQSSLKLEWMENPWEDINTSYKWLLNIKNKFKPDIVHLNSYSHGSVNWNVPSVVVAHSDVFSWYQAVKHENPPPLWNEYHKRVVTGIQNSDYLVAPSEFMLSAVNKNFCAKKEKKVIYNARDRKFFVRKPKNNFILGVGRVWDEAKNLTSLVKISTKVKWTVYIAGENHNPENGNSFALSNIDFLGCLSVKEIANYFSSASIYSLPAKYEPFGLTVLEAAISHCALILGDIPSLREIWGNNAIYVNPDNEKSLTDAINFLIKDDDFRNELAEKAYRHSFNFTLDKMCSEYLSLYSSLIANQKIKRKVRNEC